MVTIVFSAESLFSVRNHCYQCGIIILIKGVLFSNDHVTQLMVWEVPSSLNILFDVMVWKIPVYHPALVLNFYYPYAASFLAAIVLDDHPIVMWLEPIVLSRSYCKDKRCIVVKPSLVL